MPVDRLLINILLTQSASRQEQHMIRFIKKCCYEKKYKVVKDHDNLYVTKGTSDLYPCFVAHTDTCATIIPTNHFKIFRAGPKVYGYNPIKKDNTQVGFDDKIGIYIALKMLDYLPFGKAFFPHAE